MILGKSFKEIVRRIIMALLLVLLIFPGVVFADTINTYESELKKAYDSKDTKRIVECLKKLSDLYGEKGESEKAFYYTEELEGIINRASSEDANKQYTNAKEKFQLEKREQQLEMEKKEYAIKNVELKNRIIMNLFIGVNILIFSGLGFIIFKEKKRVEKLLLNILPIRIVDRLRKKGYTEPESFENVTVYFSDIVDFAKVYEKYKPKELIDELNEIFDAYDTIMKKHGCERIKTISDAYLAVAGLSKEENTQKAASDMLKAAQEILEYIKIRNKEGEKKWEIRIGIHTGNLVGGIVGIRKYIYDIFGDTVNLASHMESTCEPMHINVSHTTYELTKDTFQFENRGYIKVKGKGYVEMHYLETGGAEV